MDYLLDCTRIKYDITLEASGLKEQSHFFACSVLSVSGLKLLTTQFPSKSMTICKETEPSGGFPFSPRRAFVPTITKSAS
mmetsp:Transcript_97627/g.173892  ORF Transcript_97627/g.173892 Transcript_97627/m.173892 type:complete len:80 (+) Transcript_97627:136-375(+)